MSACVSPPQPSVSHIVVVAASIAQAASTALPPFWNIMEPAAAPSGLPVIATQCRPCSGGFCVAARARPSNEGAANSAAQVPRTTARRARAMPDLRGSVLCTRRPTGTVGAMTEGSWEHYYRQSDDRLVSVAFDAGVSAPVSTLPILTRIVVPVTGSDRYVFFTPEEGGVLDRLGEGVEARLGPAPGALGRAPPAH